MSLPSIWFDTLLNDTKSAYFPLRSFANIPNEATLGWFSSGILKLYRAKNFNRRSLHLPIGNRGLVVEPADASPCPICALQSRRKLEAADMSSMLSGTFAALAAGFTLSVLAFSATLDTPPKSAGSLGHYPGETRGHIPPNCVPRKSNAKPTLGEYRMSPF